MTRQVFDNSMTAHIWAQQTQESGRSHNGNLFFEGPALFSYGRHYCAGFIATTADGGRVPFVNGDSYSISTGRHVSDAWRAVDYSGHRIAGLTQWARLLERATRERSNPGAFPFEWIPASRGHRRAFLKEARRELVNNWPGDLQAAVAILRVCGADMGEAQRAARAALQKVERKAAATAEARNKEKTRVQRHEAATLAAMTSADVARELSRRLGRWQSAQRGAEDLAQWGREVHRAAKAAKAAGWKARARVVQSHYRQIRAALQEVEQRHAAAFRNRNLRELLKTFRESRAGLARFLKESAAGELPGTSAYGTPYEAARWHGALATAAERLADWRGRFREDTRRKFRELAAEARKEEAAAKERAEAARYAEQEARRAAWLEGEGRAAAYDLKDSRGGPLLRVVNVERDDSGAIVAGELQTSAGAAVPLCHAIRVFRMVKHCKDTGRAWQRNGATIRVGQFQVDSIDAAGNFRAGCHAINWPEVERLAVSLGVFDLPPVPPGRAEEGAAA